MRYVCFAMTRAPADLPVLIVIPVSHFCEKARWALDRAGIAYATESHMPMLHWAATVPRGGRSVPLLVTTDAGALCDSRDILEYANAHAPPDGKIYPDSAAERAEVDELSAEFDRKLGPSTRRWVYFHAFADKAVALSFLGADVSALQRNAFGAMFPVARAMMRRAMKVDAPNTERSVEYVRKTFAAIGARLGGRRFLVGDRFSAADLTFASLAAPMILPPEYSVKIPGRDRMPREMLPLVEELRATPAGAHALRMFRDERRAHPG
jgi:glutathione S-transferase